MNMKKIVLKAAFSVAILSTSTMALAADYMPFVLGSTSSDTVASATQKAKVALTSNGFEVVGQYAPNTKTQILVVTNSVLKNLAASSKNGGFGAMERVAVVNHNGQTEVSYTNPSYQFNVYQMKGDISPVQASMEKALGNQADFGAEKALSASDLREYHYKFMMPYFGDTDELASYDSYDEAIQTVEAGLAAKKGGVSKVYRIDIPGSKMTVFGVSISKGEGADNNILSQIDKGAHSHAAYLPYEILVNDNEAIALNGKFRIAIDWPSLSMMGSGSFMSIANAPDEITAALEAVAEK